MSSQPPSSQLGVLSSAQLKERADALRAEARSARSEAQEAHFKRRSQLDLERERVATSKETAEYAARQASERAAAAKEAAQASASSANVVEQESAAAAKKGDARVAEETAETANYARRMQHLEDAREQQSTLDAARFRREAAGHDERLRELEFEIKAANRSKSEVEVNLDKLEEQGRLYDEAWRKFAAAEAAADDIPRRAELELEAEAAIAAAEAISIDRAAIRVLAPGLPGSTSAMDTSAELEGIGDVTASASLSTAEPGNLAPQLDPVVGPVPATADGNDVDVVGDLDAADQFGPETAAQPATARPPDPVSGTTSSDRPADELDVQSAGIDPAAGTAAFEAEWATDGALGGVDFAQEDASSEAPSVDDVAASFDTAETSV